jgi:tetratricopeptide (TPR) repeat protein
MRGSGSAVHPSCVGTLWLVAMLLLFGSLCRSVSMAQGPSGTEPPEYRDAIERGLEEYRLGNFQEARDQFARAHAFHPNARTLRGLGFTAFELRNYVEAEDYLQSALDSREKPLEGNLRGETEQMLARARSYVGQIRLDLQPANAVVIVDGIRSPDASGTLRLGVGDHVLEFRADGFLGERRALRVQGGQGQALKVALSRLSVSGSSRPPQERSSLQPIYKRWWLWTAVGVVVAGAAVGLAVGLSSKPHDTYRGVPSDRTPAGVGIAALRVQP